jgi:16S rRNA G966 N2-methylase RsmD
MPFLADMKNALSLLSRGELRGFFFRMQVHMLHIDLKNTYLDDLNLPEERSHYYANSGGPHLDKVLRDLKITRLDAIVDFGSGKGGALITFSRYPFSKITGVELSPELVNIAEENLRRLNIGMISMIVSDAAEFTDLDDYNYFYFFSPFPANVMSAVIKNISASLTRKPRTATIIYFNPECHEAIVTDSPFVKIKEFHHHELGYYIYSNKT